jgi:hypothetical protein
MVLILVADFLVMSVLIGYAQLGKCNERYAGDHADPGSLVRPIDHMAVDTTITVEKRPVFCIRFVVLCKRLA